MSRHKFKLAQRAKVRHAAKEWEKAEKKRREKK